MKMLPIFSCVGLLVLAAGLHASPPTDQQVDTTKEVQALQGAWKIVSAEFSGKVMKVGDIGIDRIIVADDRMTLMNGEQEVANYGLELYPDRKPKGMLWKKQTKEGVGLQPVIYEVDGAKLKLCFPLLSTEKPTEPPKPPESFDTNNKPLGLLVCEREKP